LERLEARFVLVGSGPLLTLLRRRAERLGVGEWVLFTGERSDALEVLAALDCFVLPSLTEGLGTSVLDAFALGVPVVASRAGGIPEMVEDGKTGLLVEPGNPEALASAILRILENRGLAEHLARNAKRLQIERFSDRATAEGTLRVYQEVLDRHTHA